MLRCKIGDKRYNLNSNDFTVLIRLLAFTVRKSIAATADSDILSGANEMLGKLGYKGSVADNMLRDFSEKYGFATPEEKEALAIAFGADTSVMLTEWKIVTVLFPATQSRKPMKISLLLWQKSSLSLL